MKNNITPGTAYYLHTDPIIPEVPSLGPRATIAIAVTKGHLFWGLSICSDSDNFERKTGRELAHKRLQNGFRRTPIKGKLEQFETTSDLMAYYASALAAKISSDFEKWKRYISEFEDNLEATDEPLDTQVEPHPAGATQALYEAICK